MKRSPGWMYFRVAYLVAVACFAPWVVSQGAKDFDKYGGFTLRAAFFLGGLVCIGVIFVILLQSGNRFSDEKWERPSWYASPFRIRQPIQSMHFGAWTFMVLGLATAFYSLFVHANTLVFTQPLTIGLGAYAGVWVSVFVFKDKFLPLQIK